ncbi:tetratricopeptide repeat protein [Yanghanlia caeni]|uniref:Tetratricopeptide repeat protein n=1 Tax=Yanghanlia caeni TaxID=3064283 RepID=A0ABU1D2J3_9BURK|nr:tetratricopeptide repeat protein [Alcaligenaceae bacterium LG-2]
MKRFLAVLIAASFGALVTPPAAHAQLTAPLLLGEPPQIDPAEQIRLRPGELPAVRLTSDILYRLLAAEIAAQRSAFDTASELMYGLARETSDPRLARRAFQFAMAARDLPGALKAARQWVLVSPNDPDAVASSLALAASSGQTTGLAGTLRSRIEEASNKEHAIAQAASIVGKMNDKRVAYQVLEEALPESVRSIPLAQLALADAAWAAEDPVRALQAARAALELAPTSEMAAQRVLEYGLSVDSRAAIRETEAYVERHPEMRRLRLLLVNRLVGRHEFDAALAQVAAMRERNPEDFDLLYTEAEVNMRAERYDRAKALLHEYISVQEQRGSALPDKATTAGGDASDARLLLVQIAEKEGDRHEAIRQLDLIDDPGLRFQAQIHKAVLVSRSGDLEGARRTLQALTPQSDNERTVLALTTASIYRDSGRSDEAIAVLEQADAEMPDMAEIKYDLAMLYERQGRYDDFERLMREIIRIAPDNANAYNSLGYTFADRNVNLHEAEELLEQALELEPDNPYILDSVGWYLYRTGDYSGALEYLRRSWHQLPSGEVAAHLGEVLWMMQRKAEARDIWKEGLKHEPENEVLQKTLKRFGVRLH